MLLFSLHCHTRRRCFVSPRRKEVTEPTGEGAAGEEGIVGGGVKLKPVGGNALVKRGARNGVLSCTLKRFSQFGSCDGLRDKSSLRGRRRLNRGDGCLRFPGTFREHSLRGIVSGALSRCDSHLNYISAGKPTLTISNDYERRGEWNTMVRPRCCTTMPADLLTRVTPLRGRFCSCTRDTNAGASEIRSS